MFKSPVKGIAIKKSPISFIKTAASPRQANKTSHAQTSKTLSTAQNDFAIDQFTKANLHSLLSLDITLDKPLRTIKLAFSFSPETEIGELTDFMRRELKEQYVYFKAKSINVEYLLTLQHRKVRELGVKRLELLGVKLRIDRRGNFLNNLEVIKCLGTGGFSKVYLARGYGRLMAMKVIDKHFILENQKQNIVENQREILQKCSGHPFITQLYLSFQTQHYLVFCMEYCNGGELFNLLRKVRRMKEADAKFYFLETLAAISHLHSQRILYRDLKPQNIIIDSQGHVRLADYGLSKTMKDDMTYSFCGSAEYMAPEMLLKKGHGFEIDYYCLGALLYELVIGLPPYYSRDQNQLFSNILHSDLEFPPHADLSKDLRKMLQRLLEKDVDLRFNKVAEIFAAPWLNGCRIQDVLAKRLEPPYKTNMFESNFDTADFEDQEQMEILKLQKEKDRDRMSAEEVCFPGFYYLDEELQRLQAEIEKNSNQRLNFSKKPAQMMENVQTQKQQLWRNVSMKSIDNSQIFMENQTQHSPRIVLNRSNDKFRVLPSQASQFLNHPSYLSNPKGSEIINTSKTSENTSSSAFKLTSVRSVPQIDKHQILYQSNDRFSSPININNYINIYTNKSPPSHQLNFNTNHFVPHQTKKTLSYGTVSYDKNINSSSSSFKNSSNPTYNNTPASLERAKLGSLQKPSLAANLLKGSINSQSSSLLNNRGYLSNFKERFNPNQKIKKSYKNNEKLTFNFFAASTPYKQS